MARLSRLFETTHDADGTLRMRVRVDGAALLRVPLLNKGTGFSQEERVALGIDGLLPPRVQPMELQVERTYAAFRAEPTALAKYSNLRALQERNEVLFFALLERHLAEMLPIIYTPTVGDAVKNASALYQNARGLSLSPLNIGRAREVAGDFILDDVRIIVATDSSAILGIGDQGWGGLAISIGKLALYTAGGVSPYQSLPVGLDVGTDREDLVASVNYLGVPQKRLRGAEYLAFLDRFVDAVRTRWPGAVVQWEDLSKDTAFDVLQRYRKKLPSFNDDIQGTGAVALAGLLSACALRGRKLRDEVVVVHGAGAGGAGVARAIHQGMVREGLTPAEAKARVLVLDSRGLLVEGRKMEDYKGALAQEPARVAGWGDGPLLLEDVIRRSQATVLLGLSGQPGCFTEPMVRALCEHVERPVVFPLSNPTSSSEATPADILAWSGGRAIVATGSPFEPVRVDGRDVPIGQGNNAFIFPGLGFGAILAEASEITDGMVAAASYALADYVLEKHVAHGLIYPPVDELRAVSERVATRVIEQAFAEGMARTTRTTAASAGEYVHAKAWLPRYLPFDKVLSS